MAKLSMYLVGGKMQNNFRDLFEIPGVVVPPLTPFRADLKVDYSLLQTEIDYVVTNCKASAISAAGIETQEYQYLSFEERRELVQRTLEFVDGRCPVFVGISHPSLRARLELIQMAEKLGAGGVQLLAPLRPFGGQPTLSEVIRYFSAVEEETALPIMLYLNPGPGAEVPIDWTIEIAKLDNVHYIKESSRDLARVSRLIVEIDHAGHARYFTTMQMLLATLELGGPGAEMPPPAARIANEVVKAFKSRDYEKAARFQLQFALFPSRWMHRGLAPVMKAAMDIIGVSVGDPYPPFEPLSADEKAALATYLKTTCLFRKENDHAIS
jgi:4-hydroxy-tetrahydrodipicolinate synthase